MGSSRSTGIGLTLRRCGRPVHTAPSARNPRGNGFLTELHQFARGTAQLRSNLVCPSEHRVDFGALEFHEGSVPRCVVSTDRQTADTDAKREIAVAGAGCRRRVTPTPAPHIRPRTETGRSRQRVTDDTWDRLPARYAPAKLRRNLNQEATLTLSTTRAGATAARAQRRR